MGMKGHAVPGGGATEVVYEAHNISMDARVRESVLQELIDTYMSLGANWEAFC